MTDSEVALPEGEYAIVELFGHTTLSGRIAEVERFGAKMLAIEPIFAGKLLPMCLHGGAAIYRLTPCTAEQASKKAPSSEWSLPDAVRAIVPPQMLEAPRAVIDEGEDEDAEDGVL